MPLLPQRLLPLLLLGLALALPTTEARAGWVWTAETGWYNPAKAVLSSPDELFAEAEKAFESKSYEDAAVGYERLLKTYPLSPQAKAAQVRLLEAYFLAENFGAALKVANRILATAPDNETVSKVVQYKYEIGLAYIGGAPRYIFGVPFSGKGTGLKTLEGIANRYPFQPVTDDALYRLAETYFHDEKYERAATIYDRLIRVYSESPWVGIAEYQIGEATLRRVKGVEYDFALVDQAERRFLRYRRRFPRGDKREEADEQLRRIDRYRSEKLLGIARFYLREKRMQAARFYLQKIIRDHPDTSGAQEARALLQDVGVDNATR